MESRQKQELAALDKEMTDVDADIALRFPKYKELTSPEPSKVIQLRALLGSDEAMLVYALGASNFALVVKSDGAWFTKLKVRSKDVEADVSLIRNQMETDENYSAKVVSVATLYKLYQGVLQPLEAQLKGVNHLIVVPSGALQSIPFGMLVTKSPKQIDNLPDYSKVDWLIKRYSVSMLPSVGSIQIFRQFVQLPLSQMPFVGFGDPSIGEAGGNLSRNGTKSPKIDIAAAFRNVIAKSTAENQDSPVGSEIADVNVIRWAPSLPDTAQELRLMAQTLKAGEDSLWLRDNATETNLKRMTLSQFRIIAFATHGVLAGEVKGIGEPGLILTPPKVGTAEDDGYLSASEIARLELNSDWVILSACNTAASDGTPGAQGLSGLAKAFFYSGARTLLVSHWPVMSQATVLLTTEMLRELEENPRLGKASAQRKAMLSLMNNVKHPEYAHPLYWAPFVVVGDGGAIK
jgi:CHAT domain-containing protein